MLASALTSVVTSGVVTRALVGGWLDFQQGKYIGRHLGERSVSAVRLDIARSLHRRLSLPRKISGLTERELNVLRLLAEGLDTAEVSGQLFYSERTVKNIIHDITSRLELRNRTHAVAYAIKAGLI